MDFNKEGGRALHETDRTRWILIKRKSERERLQKTDRTGCIYVKRERDTEKEREKAQSTWSHGH